MDEDGLSRNRDLRRRFSQGKLTLNEQLYVDENPDLVDDLLEPDWSPEMRESFREHDNPFRVDKDGNDG